jgi:hypothetical protein
MLVVFRALGPVGATGAAGAHAARALVTVQQAVGNEQDDK